MILDLNGEGSVRVNRSRKKRAVQSNTRPTKMCPICDGTTKARFLKKGYPIRDCLECGHRFAEIVHAQDHVARVYDNHYFRGAGAGYADYLTDGELLISHGRRYARILSRYMNLGSVLDVGAAAGFILKGFEEIGWKGAGIEPNSAMAEHARRRLGVMVETGTLEDSPSNGRYDVIAMIQIVAHFVDPRRALDVASKMTKPGGYWLIEAWNRKSWTARILGEAWHEYSPPSVLHWFSIETLGELVQDFGLQEIARGRPTKWISPTHAKLIAQSELGGSVLGKLITSVTKLIPERLPLPYMLDDVFWALYQRPEAGCTGDRTTQAKTGSPG